MLILIVFLVLAGCLLGFVGLAFGAQAFRWTLMAVFASPFVFIAFGLAGAFDEPSTVSPAVAAESAAADRALQATLACGRQGGYSVFDGIRDVCVAPTSPGNAPAPPPPADLHALALQQLLADNPVPLGK